MAFTPISNTIPQYYAAGVPALNHYIKFYIANTTTPVNHYTDRSGGTTQLSAKIDSEGYPLNPSNARFIPHIDQAYKIALFTSLAAADANDFMQTVWVIDDIDPVVTDAGNVPNGSVSQPSLTTALYNDLKTGRRNAIINGNFNINQRAVSGTVVLSSGVYGHDRFKAGSGGCTYTFATVDNVTTLTISAGTLIQVIEGESLETATYSLSWSGTAQAQVDGDGYDDTGLTASVTGGTDVTIEFDDGTLSLVQFEKGSTVTDFEVLPIGEILGLCRRYFAKLNFSSSVNTTGLSCAVQTAVPWA